MFSCCCCCCFVLFCFSPPHQFSGYPAGPLATLLYWEKVHERSWAGHGDVLAVRKLILSTKRLGRPLDAGAALPDTNPPVSRHHWTTFPRFC